MKKKILYFVMAVCMVLMFAGCSSKGKGEGITSAADNQRTVSAYMNRTETAEQRREEKNMEESGKDDAKKEDTEDAETKAENSAKEETKQVSLNVENDTFTFDALLQQIGSSEEEAVKVLGAKEKSDSYATELFGEKVVIILNSKDENISGIQLAFEDTDAELLTNAIAEQLGSDGEAEEKKVTWKLDNCTVKLQQTEKGCDVEIFGKE